MFLSTARSKKQQVHNIRDNVREKFLKRQEAMMKSKSEKAKVQSGK